MKKIIIIMIAMTISLLANEIQVFSTNTMHITLDKNSKVTNIFNGELNDFYKNSEKILKSKEVAETITNGIHQSAMYANNAGNLYNGHGINANQMIAGGVGALAGYAIGSGITWAISDNEYVSVNVVTNSKSETTLIETLIVSNYSISNKKVKEIGQKEIQKIIKKD